MKPNPLLRNYKSFHNAGIIYCLSPKMITMQIHHILSKDVYDGTQMILQVTLHKIIVLFY